MQDKGGNCIADNFDDVVDHFFEMDDENEVSVSGSGIMTHPLFAKYDYVANLERWLDAFEAHQLFPVFLTDMIVRPYSTMNRINTHAGLSKMAYHTEAKKAKIGVFDWYKK